MGPGAGGMKFLRSESRVTQDDGGGIPAVFLPG